MPNWCSIYAEIVCVNKVEAEKLESKLNTIFDAANAEHRGAYLGSEKRYLFAFELERDEENITLHGEVKWALEHEEMLDWTKFLTNIAKVTHISLDYEECGCLLRGCYNFDGEVVIDNYLPQEFYPTYNDEENFCEMLDDALAKHGVEVNIGSIELDLAS